MGGDSRSGPPLPQNLDYLRRAGLPTPGAGNAYGTAAGTTSGVNPGMQMLQQLFPNAQYNPSALSSVDAAGLSSGDTGDIPGYAEGGALGQGNSNGAPLQFGQQVNPAPQFNTQSAYNNYAVPNQNLMDYPQQGQPNQPYAATLPVPSNPSPDMGGMSASNNMGFDNSGSDAGVGGQPVAQKQTPLQGQAFGQPPSLSQYMPQQGLQIQGNPTAMPVQYTQQR